MFRVTDTSSPVLASAIRDRTVGVVWYGFCEVSRRFDYCLTTEAAKRTSLAASAKNAKACSRVDAKAAQDDWCKKTKAGTCSMNMFEAVKSLGTCMRSRIPEVKNQIPPPGPRAVLGSET